MRYLFFFCFYLLSYNGSLYAQQTDSHKKKFAFRNYDHPSKIKHLKAGKEIQVAMKPRIGREYIWVSGKLVSADSMYLCLSLSKREMAIYRVDTANGKQLVVIQTMREELDYVDINDTVIRVKMSDINWILQKQRLVPTIIATVAGVAAFTAFIIAPLISINYGERTFNSPLFFNVFYPSVLTAFVGSCVVLPILYDFIDKKVAP